MRLPNRLEKSAIANRPEHRRAEIKGIGSNDIARYSKLVKICKQHRGDHGHPEEDNNPDEFVENVRHHSDYAGAA